MNQAQMLIDLTDSTRTITLKKAGNKLKGEALFLKVYNESTQFKGTLRGRGKHWLIINANFPMPDFVPIFLTQREEYTGSTLLLFDLSKIDSDTHVTLQWSQTGHFLPIHILGTRKPSIDGAERPTKRRRIDDASTNNQLFASYVYTQPYGTMSPTTHPNLVSQRFQPDDDPISTLLYASSTPEPSKYPSTAVASNTNVMARTNVDKSPHHSSPNVASDDSSKSSSDDHDNDTRALKLLARAMDELKSPDAKKRAKCMEELYFIVSTAFVCSATELIESNPILADTVCRCIILGLQDKDKETFKWALDCLSEANGNIGPAMEQYHEDILPLLIETVLRPVESSKCSALTATEYYLREEQVPASLIEEHFDELMTNLIRTISEPVEWDQDQRESNLDCFRRDVFDIILTLIDKYPQLNFNEYIYSLLPHIKMTLEENHWLRAKPANKLIQKLLKPFASTALDLCTLVLKAAKDEGNTEVEDRFKSSMMNLVAGSEPNFSESDSDS